MQDDDETATSVRVRFVTLSDEIRVTTDPFSVPVRLGRKGLSDIINHLLGRGANAATTFDFLVYDTAEVDGDGGGDGGGGSGGGDVEDGARLAVTAAFMRSATKRLLRRSLRAHLADFGVSGERLVTLEYAPSLPRPQDGGRSPSAPDWIGAVAGFGPESVQALGGSPAFVAGCYDGKLLLVDGASAQPRGEVVGAHDGAIKALAACGDFVVSSGHDRTVRTWRLEGSSSGMISGLGLTPQGLGEGGGDGRELAHENSVECVAVKRADAGSSSGGHVLLSGDWDGRLCLWRVCEGGGEGGEEESGGASAPKKRKAGARGQTARAALHELAPAAAWKAHAQCVSAVLWQQTSQASGADPASGGGGGGEGGMAATASWDHSIKTWDVERQDAVVTINGSKVATCMAASQGGGPWLLATGHPDGAVKLWDPRVPGGGTTTGCAATLVGPGSSSGAAAGCWVSDLSWCPGSEHVLASASHDGLARIFDARSGNSRPLFTLRAHGDKAKATKGLCVGWSGAALASGGADCQLKTFGLEGLGASS